MARLNLDDYIRKVPDFPKKGILFYDITSVLASPKAFRYCIDMMMEKYAPAKLDAVAAIESRGFIFAGAFADRAGLPLLLVRKKGKLPGKTLSKSYKLEYGEGELEMHEADIPRGKRVLLVDDLIATGGTLKASAEILRSGGATVVGVFGVIGLPFLKFRECLSDLEVTTLIDYSSE